MSNIVKIKKIVRILSVTSIQQLFIGLACLKKTEEKNNIYHDYLIINNTMLLNETVESIKDASSIHNIYNIIDFRQDLELFNLSISNNNVSERGWIYNKFIKLITTVLMGRNINELINKLQKYIIDARADEIYVRYKIGFPEKVLLNAFPRAEIHLFEDGFGDYLPKINKIVSKHRGLINKITSIQSRVIKLIGNSVTKNFNSLKSFNERVVGIYELISNSNSHRKKELQNKVQCKFINIVSGYIEVLKQAKVSSYNNDLKGSFVLVLPSAFSAAKLWYKGKNHIGIDVDISYTADIIRAFRKLYPDERIIIKTHPRTPAWLIEAFVKNFEDNSCHVVCYSNLPAEVFFLDEKFVAVFGGFSSSLMYAKNIFNKTAYFTSPPDGITGIYPSEFIPIVKDTFYRLGIKELKI